MSDIRCTSCGVRLIEEGSVVFPCPYCGEVMIGRCERCRNQAVKYVCKNCGFEGP